MRKNKREFPSILVEANGRDVYSSIFLFTPSGNSLPPVTLQSYITRSKKPLIFLSTFHQNSNLIPYSRTKLSRINDLYNQFKCGVDLIDQVINSWSVQRKTNRWPMNVFYFILNIAITNTYTLSKKLDLLPENCSKRDFMERLALELCIDYVINRDYTHLDTAHREDAKSFIAKYNEVFSESVPLNIIEPISSVLKNRLSDNNSNLDKDYCGECLELNLKKRNLSKVATFCKKCSKFLCKTHFVLTCKDCFENFEN